MGQAHVPKSAVAAEFPARDDQLGGRRVVLIDVRSPEPPESLTINEQRAGKDGNADQQRDDFDAWHCCVRLTEKLAVR